MTKAQRLRLYTVLAKLESLENEERDAKIRDYLRDGKSDLLCALRAAESGGHR